MKQSGAALPFNAMSLLEKTWDQRGERITLKRAQQLWPDVSLSVLWHAFEVLKKGGALRTRRVKVPRRKPFTYFYVTPVGRRLLRELLPLWQIWGKIQPREVLMFGRREKTYLKLAVAYKSLFGSEPKDRSQENYWRRLGPRDPAFS